MGVSANAGITGDLQAAGGIEGFLSLPPPGAYDDRESLFKHLFKPKVCFAQDWLEQPFKSAAFGGTTDVVMPKHYDILYKQYVHWTFAGIIGEQGDLYSHKYPYLVAEGLCSATLKNCVPTLERITQEFETDAVYGVGAGVSNPTTATIGTATTAVATATTELGTAVTNAANAVAALQAAPNTTLAHVLALKTLYATQASRIALLATAKETLAIKIADLAALKASNRGALTQRPFVHWTQGVAFRATENILYQCGDVKTDEIDFRYLHAIEELQGSAGKRHTYQAGMYEDREALIRASMNDQEMYVSLPFWYTHFIGISKTVAMQQLTNVSFELTIAKKEDLVVCSDSKTKPFLSQADGTDWGVNMLDRQEHDRESSGKELGDGDVKVAMLYNIYYLEEAERDVHIERARLLHEGNADVQVITFTQRNKIVVEGQPELVHEVKANHAIFEILVTAQLDSNRVSGNWFNYSRCGPEAGGTGGYDATKYPHLVRTNANDADIITSIGVDQNSQMRFKPAISQFWRVVVPQVSHTNIPDKFAGHYIYTICWAVFPEDVSTYSGSINITRILSLEIKLTFHASVKKERVYVDVQIRTWGLYTMFSNVGGMHFGG